MLNQKTWSRLTPLFLFVVLLLPNAQAVDPYDVTIKSENFEPNQIVTFEVSGPINMTFNIRITTVADGDIVAGRDAQLNATGKYIFSWNPSYEGELNVTVVFATGFTISKGFLIQEKVTDQDIAEVYVSLFGVQTRLTKLIEEVRTLAQVGLALGGLSFISLVVMFIYLRKNVSRMESNWEMWMKSENTSAMLKKISVLERQVSELKKQ